MIGSRFGSYQIEALLGRGGMGEVYRAVDTAQDGRRVALKVLTPALSADPQFAARFRREAEIAARLSDPHVVPIHRYGEVDGRLFLDMQLVDGRELSDVVKRDGALAPERAVAIVEQIAGALDAAHADGLVHRDVKPSNILLTEPGGGRAEFAYLLDFGIARATDTGSRTALTRTGAVIGTLAYMAPERFLARPAGPSADVYSLACVLHELLTGARPYPGTGYEAQVAGHLQQPPPRPHTLRPDLPTGLDAVVARGMAKEPSARYPTAGDLASAAGAALTGSGAADLPAEPVADDAAPPTWVPGAIPIPPPPPPPPPVWIPPAAGPAPTARPRRWWIPVLAAAVVVIAVVATVLVATQPAAGPALVADGPAAPAAEAPDALPTGGPVTERVIVGKAPDVWAPGFGDLDGTPVIVTRVGFTIEVLDMATGEQIGATIEDSSGAMAATAVRLDGRSVVVTGGVDRVIRMWDLGTGQPLPTTMTGHTGIISALALTQLDGRPVLVTGGGDDQTVRRWDLTTAAPIGEPITGAGARVEDVEVVQVDGRPVIVGKGFDAPVHAWDLATGSPVGAPMPSQYTTNITVGDLPGGPVVLGRDGLESQVLDVRTGAAEGGYQIPDYFSTAALTTVNGRPIIAVVDGETIRLHDLRTGSQIGSPMTGHESLISTLTPVAVGDRVFLVSTSSDRSIRIWDLTTRSQG